MLKRRDVLAGDMPQLKRSQPVARQRVVFLNYPLSKGFERGGLQLKHQTHLTHQVTSSKRHDHFYYGAVWCKLAPLRLGVLTLAVALEPVTSLYQFPSKLQVGSIGAPSLLLLSLRLAT
jgi:hypothetical protein